MDTKRIVLDLTVREISNITLGIEDRISDIQRRIVTGDGDAEWLRVRRLWLDEALSAQAKWEEAVR